MRQRLADGYPDQASTQGQPAEISLFVPGQTFGKFHIATFVGSPRKFGVNTSEDTEEHDPRQIKLVKITDNLLNTESNDVELVKKLVDSTKLDLNVSLLSEVPNFGNIF